MSYKDKKIEPSDILSIDQYTTERKTLRKNLVAIKKDRRVNLGPHATFYFENYYTMKAQIQEMLYIEKGGDEQLKDEMEAYNPLIPRGISGLYASISSFNCSSPPFSIYNIS